MAPTDGEGLTEELVQKRLLRRREELGVTSAKAGRRTLSTSSSPSNGRVGANVAEVMEIFARRTAGPEDCQIHPGNPLPCQACLDDIERRRLAAEDLARSRELELREHPERLLNVIGVGKRYHGASLDNFVGGDAVKAICRACGDDPFDLVLCGPSGSGKTHLAVAIVRELVKSGRYGAASVRFVTASELLLEIRASYRDTDSDEAEIAERYGSVPVLVLDDLGAEKVTDWSVATLYLIIDRRYREMRPTIVTSNLSVAQIGEALSPRIASRLASGRVVEMKMQDWRMRRR